LSGISAIKRCGKERNALGRNKKVKEMPLDDYVFFGKPGKALLDFGKSADIRLMAYDAGVGEEFAQKIREGSITEAILTGRMNGKSLLTEKLNEWQADPEYALQKQKMEELAEKHRARSSVFDMINAMEEIHATSKQKEAERFKEYMTDLDNRRAMEIRRGNFELAEMTKSDPAPFFEMEMPYNPGHNFPDQSCNLYDAITAEAYRNAPDIIRGDLEHEIFMADIHKQLYGNEPRNRKERRALAKKERRKSNG
jgi:hypothetical protein